MIAATILVEAVSESFEPAVEVARRRSSNGLAVRPRLKPDGL